MKKMNWKKSLTLTASAALALSLLAGCGAQPAEQSSTESKAVGTVLLSVNPEIEVEYDKSGLVLEIEGLNKDGKTVVTPGSITVDGQEILSLTRASLRRAYSMVLQDTWLFSGTVYENLAYGKEGVTLEQVRAAARAAKIDRFIEALPQGYDTVLRDGGNSISKGQRQLLTIARAMLLDAPMLILDEATSNVDTRTERRIQAAMLRLMEGRTCFVIAHRLSTIRNADVIAVLREGTVAECGTHDELMRRGGYYSELYRAQFDAAQDAG